MSKWFWTQRNTTTKHSSLSRFTIHGDNSWGQINLLGATCCEAPADPRPALWIVSELFRLEETQKSTRSSQLKYCYMTAELSLYLVIIIYYRSHLLRICSMWAKLWAKIIKQMKARFWHRDPLHLYFLLLLSASYHFKKSLTLHEATTTTTTTTTNSEPQPAQCKQPITLTCLLTVWM